MDRRELLKLLTSAAGMAFDPSHLSALSLASDPGKGSDAMADNFFPGYAITPAFDWLRMGDVKPAGWIKEQMLRDLRSGFAGNLAKLCKEASSDIFVTGRNTLSSQNTTNELGVNWWNGETEGNWRAGHIMMACLSEDPASVQEAANYVQHILASQDADGYLGVFGPDTRFKHQGELWTQACLMRGLLAYSELTGDKKVLQAVQRAVDLTIKTYRVDHQPLAAGESHDLMYADVLERLDDLTGNAKYRDFALWLYDTWSSTEIHWDATLSSLSDRKKGFFDHGVNTYENIRVPLWLAMTTGREDLGQASRNAFYKIARYTEMSGSAVSQEWINDAAPDPSNSEYEYCVTKELQFTFLSALQKLGDPHFADQVEYLWFNAAQGSRLPDGSAISYLTSDNRSHCNLRAIAGDTVEKRNKFSPTHSDVAVCCNPNATQVAALYVRGMWMRPKQGGLAALLYGPSSLRTSVAGTQVAIEQRTNYPFESIVEFEVSPERDVEFPILLRDPGWSRNSTVVCEGARITRQRRYWQVLKQWKAGDQLRLRLTPEIEPVTASNSEVALRYGALLFALPIASRKITLRAYPLPGFEDSGYEPVEKPVPALGFPPGEQWYDSGFRAESNAKATNPLRPFDDPPVVIRGQMVAGASNTPLEATLVPLGSAPILRRVTFPLVSEHFFRRHGALRLTQHQKSEIQI